MKPEIDTVDQNGILVSLKKTALPALIFSVT